MLGLIGLNSLILYIEESSVTANLINSLYILLSRRKLMLKNCSFAPFCKLLLLFVALRRNENGYTPSLRCVAIIQYVQPFSRLKSASGCYVCKAEGRLDFVVPDRRTVVFFAAVGVTPITAFSAISSADSEQHCIFAVEVNRLSNGSKICLFHCLICFYWFNE